METFLIKAAQLIAALAFLVIIHEFGHFIFARIFGIKVEKFYLFFNPWFSLYKYKPKAKEGSDPNKTSWRDTEYGIGWVPLGGYVKIAGMIDESMDKEQMAKPEHPWEFRSKPAYQRLMVMIGGVLFNFLLAIIIYAGISFYWGDSYIRFKDAKAGMEFCDTAHKYGFVDGDIPLYADGELLEKYDGNAKTKILLAKEVVVLRDGKEVTINLPGEQFLFDVNAEMENSHTDFMGFRMPVVVKDTEHGMPAFEAGMQQGDSILAVAGVETPSFTIFTKVLSENSGKEVPIVFDRNGQIDTVAVTLTDGGKLGIALKSIGEMYPVVREKYSLLGSIPKGAKMGVDKLTGYVSSLKLIFSKEGAKSVGGFGAIGSIFPEKWNWLQFWEITAFLSVALAIMNILPIPALDGGHVLFLIWEIITRRKPSEKFLEYAQFAGMLFLLILLIYANGNDIYRFLLK